MKHEKYYNTRNRPVYERRYFRTLCISGLIICTALIVLMIIYCCRVGASFTEKVEKNGGFVLYQEHGPFWVRNLIGEKYPFKSVSMVTFGPGTTDEDLAGIESLSAVTSVSLTQTKVVGPGL